LLACVGKSLSAEVARVAGVALQAACLPVHLRKPSHVVIGCTVDRRFLPAFFEVCSLAGGLLALEISFTPT
jgi:hypothetical protein